jgi:hypothetical protein
MALFDDPKTRRRNRFIGQYGTAARARTTIRRMRSQPCGFQRRVAGTMYARAKYHAHQTADMRAAMRVYRQFLKAGCAN